MNTSIPVSEPSPIRARARKCRDLHIIGPTSALAKIDPAILILLQRGAIDLRGSVGDITFRKTAHGTVVSRKPDMSRTTWSPAQRAHRERFGRAVARYRAMMADPKQREICTAGARQAGLPVSAYVIGRLMKQPVSDTGRP